MKMRYDGYESEFIENIVEEVYSKITRVHLHIADYLVGLESRVNEVKSLLCLGSDGVVQMVGICGAGGIGKTTLAKAVYNSISDRFDGLCFLNDVRQNSMKYGLLHLQQTVLSEICGHVQKIKNVSQGGSIIKRTLQGKKVLLVVDDVDQMEQLEAIVGKLDWFGLGSRVIITTRDKHLLTFYGVGRTYEVEALSEKESFDLFSWNAFKTDKVDPSYVDISKHVLTFASGLPLALQVVGSYLCGRSLYEWRSALDQYVRVPEKHIQSVLKISFDSLEKEEKCVFLDIACFFNGHELEGVKDILSALYGESVKYSIEELIEKSLIKIDNGLVTLHNLIQDMGREIVRLESPVEPGKRSRLWLPEDVVRVLETNSGSDTIESLFLDFPKDEVNSNRSKGKEVYWNGQALNKMQNLKILVINSGSFNKGPTHLPNSLKVLKWRGYPSPSLPNDFHPKKLAILELPASCISETKPIQGFVSLKLLNFSNCEQITHIPDLSGLSNLIKLSFRDCENLSNIHESVGFLDKLTFLDVVNCKKLMTFPPYQMIERLILSYCNISDDFLPIGLTWFANVKDLDLSGNNFTILHVCIKECHFLRYLKLDDCVLIQEITVIPWKLETLSAKRCKSLKYMDLTGEGRSLRELILDDCICLREIEGIQPNLDHFSAKNCTVLTSLCTSLLVNQEMIEAGNKMFCLPGTNVPDWFAHHTSGDSISFWFCNKFPAIALCLVIGQVDELPISVKFSPKVLLNDIELSSGNQIVYKFRIATDHILLFDARLLIFEDTVFSDNEWNHVVVSYEDLFTDNGVPISGVAKYSGIHIFNQKSELCDFQFNDPQKTLINVNLECNSMVEAPQRGKIVTKRPPEDQTIVLSPLLTSTQFPVSPSEIGIVPQPTFLGKMPLEDMGRETSESTLDHVAYDTIIQNDPPVIQRCSEGHDVEVEEAGSCEEEFSSNTEGSDSDDPFDSVSRKLCVSGKKIISSGANSGNANLRSISEAINALELLMVKDLSEVSDDRAAHSKLHQLLDLLSSSSHPKVTVEVKETIAAFKRKAFSSFQEFQATVESVNKLKNYENHLARIQQETVAGKDQWKDIKNSVKKVSLDIKTKNSRKKELESEIETLRKQLAAKEKDLEQLVLNLKNQETVLSTYSMSYASLNEHARALSEEADDLLAASSGIKHEGEAAEVEQSRLKWTWSVDLTGQLNKMKKNILGFDE